MTIDSAFPRTSTVEIATLADIAQMLRPLAAEHHPRHRAEQEPSVLPRMRRAFLPRPKPLHRATWTDLA